MAKWKPFSEQKKGGGQRKKTLLYLRKLVEYNGGGDYLGMFNSFFEGKKGEFCTMDLPIVKKLMENLKNCYNKAQPYLKRQWLSIVQDAGFSYSSLKNSGWNMSKNYKSWGTAQDHTSEQYPGAPVPERRGRPKIDKTIKKDIIKYLKDDENSYLSANKLAVIKKKGLKTQVPVRYRNKSVTCLYHFWVLNRQREEKDICSKSTFVKILKSLKFIKKPKKDTDMCHICVNGEKNLKRLNLLLLKNNKTEEEKKLIDKLILWNTFLNQHKNISAHQRAKFKEQIKFKNFPASQAIMVLDFKQNILLNQDHKVEIGRDWYHTHQRSVFGVVLYYKEREKIKKHYFDIISNIMEHDSYFVIKAVGKVMKTKFFLSKKFEGYSFWMDNGPIHFRTKELFTFFLQLDENNIFPIQWNFFCEYHGKNPCDSRFSQISAMLKNHNADPKNNRLKNCKDVIHAIETQQKLINERRINLKKNQICSTQITLIKHRSDPVPNSRVVMDISNFKKLYYSFSVNDTGICGHVLTGTLVAKIWEKKFIEVLVKKKRQSFGKVINDELENEAIWNSLEKKFKKISNFIENPAEDLINPERDLFSLVENKTRKRIRRLSSVSPTPSVLFLDEQYKRKEKNPFQTILIKNYLQNLSSEGVIKDKITQLSLSNPEVNLNNFTFNISSLSTGSNEPELSVDEEEIGKITYDSEDLSEIEKNINIDTEVQYIEKVPKITESDLDEFIDIGSDEEYNQPRV